MRVVQNKACTRCINKRYARFLNTHQRNSAYKELIPTQVLFILNYEARGQRVPKKWHKSLSWVTEGTCDALHPFKSLLSRERLRNLVFKKGQMKKVNLGFPSLKGTILDRC